MRLGLMSEASAHCSQPCHASECGWGSSRIPFGRDFEDYDSSLRDRLAPKAAPPTVNSWQHLAVISRLRTRCTALHAVLLAFSPWGLVTQLYMQLQSVFVTG